jgi:nitrogen fixation/metabolism regulation signal transduction histidine kinase
VAGGDLSHRVDVPARGELRQLVDAFNRMTGDLAQSREKLAQAERIAAWEQIARALAHEIKNPLTPISMAIETLQRAKERNHPDFDRFFREGTATVLEEVARLKRLATEFGEFARWPKPLLSPVPPAELVRNASALYSSPPGRLLVESDVVPDLPQVQADRDQIQRALVNLVKNAIEALGGTGLIVLRAVRAGDDVIALEVADNGPGIPAGLREKIFRPYFTTKAEGTGLGLAIVQRIAGEHGGRIEVVDTPGGGTTFRLILPVVREVAPAPAVPASAV